VSDDENQSEMPEDAEDEAFRNLVTDRILALVRVMRSSRELPADDALAIAVLTVGVALARDMEFGFDAVLMQVRATYENRDVSFIEQDHAESS
jgi:hypothetical protein